MKITLLLLSVAAVLGVSGCGRGPSADAGKPDQSVSASSATPAAPSGSGAVVLPADSPKLKQIKVETVESGEVPIDVVTAPGKIEVNPNRLSHVVLPVGGKVTATLVRLGDSVKQGQPLLTLESPDADAAMSTYLQAEASCNQNKANLMKANADMDRAKDLFEHNAIAKKEVINTEASLAQAKATLDQSETTRQQALRRLDLLGLKPGNFGQGITVRAPLSGKIIEMNVVPGEFRNDTNTGVITIADLSSVWVSSDVPESAIRFIQRGERLDLELNAFPGDRFIGRVTRIADSVDPTTRTLKVSAEIPNPNERLKPEMYGKIRHVEAVHRGPVVPVGAVIQGDGQNIVYRELSPGRFQSTPVQIGEKVGGSYPVTSGLRAGDRVVTDGAMLLKAY